MRQVPGRDAFRAMVGDDRFLLSWLFDALFYLCTGVVIAASYFGFGSISARIQALSAMPVTPELVDAVYLQAYAFFGVLLAILLTIFLLYAFFQALIWSTCLRAALHWRLFLRYLLYLLVVLVFLPVVSIPFLLILLLVVGVYGTLGSASGILVMLAGAVIAWIGFTLTMPFAVYPTYAFFLEKRVFPSIGRMSYLAFTTLPKLWASYLLGGLVMLLVSQLYRLLAWADAALGGFLLMALIVSPVLAWYRLHILGRLPRHA